jgi:hypothetical protein
MKINTDIVKPEACVPVLNHTSYMKTPSYKAVLEATTPCYFGSSDETLGAQQSCKATVPPQSLLRRASPTAQLAVNLVIRWSDFHFYAIKCFLLAIFHAIHMLTSSPFLRKLA